MKGQATSAKTAVMNAIPRTAVTRSAAKRPKPAEPTLGRGKGNVVAVDFSAGFHVFCDVSSPDQGVGMTIAERQAREAHDRENPWRLMSEAKVGLLSDLLFDDMAGYYPVEESKFFLHSDGNWYRMDPPQLIYAKPMNWRPAHVYVKAERQALIKKRWNERTGG